jgi:cell division protein FtsW
LIEDGILKGYMQDELNASLMGQQTTGNCRRESFAVMDESTAGVAHVRGERPSRSGFTVLDGSASEPAARPRPRMAPQGRPQRPSPRNAGGGYNRIDLNSDPSARLRTDDQGPRVRRDYHDR